MSMSEPASPHVEVAAYLLGKLEPAEAERFEAHLEGCADCRRHLDELEGLPALLAQAAPATPLPDGLRARTLTAVRERAEAERAAEAEGVAVAKEAAEEVAVAKQAAVVEEAGPAEPAAVVEEAGPAEPPVPIGRAWWRRRWVAAAVAAALLVALAIPAGLQLFGGDGGQVTRLTLVAAEGVEGRGRVTITTTAAGRSFDVRIEDLAPPASGSLYELWAVSRQDTLERPRRVSLGTFTVGADGGAHLTAFTAAPADQFPLVGVTLEPVDGNPARTGPRVLIPGPPG
jgi:Anti-sigma-K factor rskA/Putative zinc-finger